MNISKGIVNGAQKLILYAPEGFGKSTFASKFKEPLFIDTEGSTKQLNVMRFDDTQSWDSILEAAKYVEAHPDCCQTLVIDTVDWAEEACIRKLNKDHNTKNILTLDYGKGSLFVVAEFQTLIGILDKIIAKGISVVMTAHAAMRKQELPDEMGAFDRWEMKLQSKQVKSMVKEWADLLIFGNYKTMVVEDSKTKSKKAQGNKRVMYTEHHPCWDAKNRHGLKPELPFEYEEIAFIFEETKPYNLEKVEEEPKEEQEPDVYAELRSLMEKDKISEARLTYAVSQKTGDFTGGSISEYSPEDIKNMFLSGNWDKFARYAMKFTEAEINQEEIPFK